jgi:tight adherence protein C
MDLSQLLYPAITLTVFLVISLLAAPVLLRPPLAARRMLAIARSARPDERRVGQKERLQGTILSIAKGLQARVGLAEDEKLKEQLRRGGITSSGSMNAYIASRVIGPFIGLLSGSLLHSNRLFFALSLGAIGYLVPDMWLKMKTAKRKERIRRSLPDALDLMVICVEAGLGLDQAMLRVSQELVISHPDIQQEFMQVNLEQLAGKSRLEAWKSAAERNQIPEFSLFVSMLTQADRFGTPIVRALSRFGDEIRLKRRQRAEEKAAKTKIKILFPLVLFIFPCIFIVLLAPAILNISKNMQSFK